jgi:hypothetical protein
VFTVAFYGQRIFWCKTGQSFATLCESDQSRLPLKNTLRKPVKTRAKIVSSIRNPLLYPAELRAQMTCNMSSRQLKNPVGKLKPLKS